MRLYLFFLFSQALLLHQCDALSFRDSQNRLHMYFNIGLGVNRIVPENSYFVKHVSKIGLVTYSEVGANNKFAEFFFRYGKNSVLYRSNTTNTVDFSSSSEYTYKITGLGIGIHYRLMNKEKLFLSHGYCVDLYKINSAKLSFIYNDLILKTSDTSYNINVINSQPNIKRIGISTNIRFCYKFTKIQRTKLYVNYSFMKLLKSNKRAGIDILTYNGGFVQGLALGIIYEFI